MIATNWMGGGGTELIPQIHGVLANITDSTSSIKFQDPTPGLDTINLRRTILLENFSIYK